MNFNTHKFRSGRGFTLIELMVSIVIGLFLLVGVFSVYINGRGSQKVVDEQLTMVQNARFALNAISYDLRHAGLWGRVNEFDAGMGNITNDLLPAVVGECAAGWVGNFASPVAAFDNATPYAATCTPDWAQGDVIEARYTLGNPITDAELVPGQIYVNSDVNSAAFFQGNVSPGISVDARNYLVVSNLYYISADSDVVGDGVPSLHRVTLEPGPVVTDQIIMRGIEGMEVQYGLDTDDDGQVNSYLNPSAVAPTDWINVRTIKVTLIVRSIDSLRKVAPNLDTSSSGIVNGVQVNFPNNGFRHYVISSVTKLRNQKNASGI